MAAASVVGSPRMENNGQQQNQQHQHPSYPHIGQPSPSPPHGSSPYPQQLYPQQHPPQFYGAWTPPPNPQMYPQYFTPPQQQPGYYDPNQQFAQWAYQTMMFNQQQGMVPQPPQGPSQNDFHSRGRAGSSSQSQSPVPQQQPYQGFHPYRRNANPTRSGSSSSQSQSQNQAPYPNTEDWHKQFPPLPTSSPAPHPAPYARGHPAAGSSSSVASNESSKRSRQRADSAGKRPKLPGPVPPSQLQQKRIPGRSSPAPHTRTTSSSSRSSSASSTTPPTSATSSTPRTTATAVPSSRPPTKPSPLSQGSTFSTESTGSQNKRLSISHDDSELPDHLRARPGDHEKGARVPGLKGRLRKVFSANAQQALAEEEDAKVPPEPSTPTQATIGRRRSPTDASETTIPSVKPKKSNSLFKARFNASTDNISLSSTVSSASVMIRKMGSMAKLARRNSLAGITSLFKDKDKSQKKAAIAEASVSHATAEVEPVSADLNGLSPAASLARQHTLKSKAEAAARRKQLEDERARVEAANTPNAWDGGTTARRGRRGDIVREDGSRVVVEDDSDESESPIGSDDDTYHGHQPQQQPQRRFAIDEEDEEDHIIDEDDEDATVRLSMEQTSIADDESWAVGIRRSVERTRVPSKGILKMPRSYDQEAYLDPPNAPFVQRLRANSYDAAPTQNAEPGPLARMPSPDPDHIDGLQKHPVHNNALSFLPPLSFQTDTVESPSSVSNGSNTSLPQQSPGLFNHPNASAPALSHFLESTKAPLRAATAPAKRLTFATNLSIYDTFASTVYDRRSEPATWSRLTPALAQRIKEELNSYKMEEMEVHAASRAHTQFFV